MEQTDEVIVETRASIGKRFAAAIVDLIVIPFVIGIIVGLMFAATKADQGLQMVILIGFNVGWLIFRDMVGSPGRAMVGIKLQKTDGSPVSFGTAISRNIHLMIPFVLLIGYLVELIALLSTGQRLADRWANTIVVEK